MSGKPMSREAEPHHHGQTFSSRITANRALHFVGRHHELAHWHTFISPDNDRPLWFIHGSGGVGKTMLLRMFQDDARARGLPVAYLDAGHIPPNPPAVQSALTQAVAGTMITETDIPPSILLLIDGFEYWEELEYWLRHHFLPTQPTSLKIVFAGRRGPHQDWLTDAGWQQLIWINVLAPLSDDDCKLYLSRRQVVDAHQQRLLAFAKGHPLALAIAADAVNEGHQVLDSVTNTDSDLIQPLVDSFSREASNDAQRAALNAAAVVRDLNEPLLSRMLDVEDASDLFAWLTRLSFITSHNKGVSPHDLVRDSLMSDMLKRSPGQYEQLARNASEWIVERLENSHALTWDAAARLAADAMYALREAPLVRHFLIPAEEGPSHQSLSLDRWRSGDEAVIHPMIARHEGEESLRWFQFWHQRAPAGVVVVRDTTQQAVAFFLKLDMETLDAQARDADPLTRKLWQALETQFNLHPGDHIPFIRHWVTHNYTVSNSPEKTRLLMAIHTYNLTAKNLRLSAQVFDEVGQWQESAAALGSYFLHDSDTLIGEKNWRIYYNDWLIEPPARYYRRSADRVLSYHSDFPDAPPASVPSPVATTSSSPTSERLVTYEPNKIDFGKAVSQALKHFHHPRKLRGNELLKSNLVVAGSNTITGTTRTEAQVEALRHRLKTATDNLKYNGTLGKHQARILRITYLEIPTSQKATAAALHMSYSNFRRHLKKARQELTAELWRQEKTHK